jgi:hypothetical protein
MNENETGASLAGLPRLIWFHWSQGLDALPPVARRCLESWVRLNPDWKVMFLDRTKLGQWVAPDDLPLEALRATSEQVCANAIRLALLRRHGGVWVDATSWCRKPLSGWLIHRPGAFFAFASPGPDRSMANWFLASLPGDYLVRTLEREYVGIFQKYGALKPFSNGFVQEVLQRCEDTSVFLEPLMFERLRGYPYYLFHYLFEALCHRDAEFGRRWSELPKISARPSLEPGHVGLASPVTDALRQRWGSLDSPVYKLTWRLGDGAPPPGSILAEILAGHL